MRHKEDRFILTFVCITCILIGIEIEKLTKNFNQYAAIMMILLISSCGISEIYNKLTEPKLNCTEVTNMIRNLKSDKKFHILTP